MMPTHSIICSAVIIRGGAKRILSPWVGFASNPFFINSKQNVQDASLSACSITMAFNNPLPRIWLIMGDSNFKSERPSEEQTRKMILKDVINSKLELSDQLDTILDEPDNKVLLQWFEINALDIGKV